MPSVVGHRRGRSDRPWRVELGDQVDELLLEGRFAAREADFLRDV